MEEMLKEFSNSYLSLTVGRVDEGPTPVSREAARRINYEIMS
jgi:hypothetical protein